MSSISKFQSEIQIERVNMEPGWFVNNELSMDYKELLTLTGVMSRPKFYKSEVVKIRRFIRPSNSELTFDNITSCEEVELRAHLGLAELHTLLYLFYYFPYPFSIN